MRRCRTGIREKAGCGPPSRAHLKQLVEEAIVDAYNESEQRCGLFTMIEDHLALPFETEVLGVPVTVERDRPDRGERGGRDLPPRSNATTDQRSESAAADSTS